MAVRDATCPAIYAALQAAEKGNPFAPIRGLIGSDVLAHREDWKITDNPFTVDHDPIVVVPAFRPDVALYHARLGDAAGNVWVGNRRELVIMSHAAQTSLVTVEEIYDGDLIRDEKLVAGTIPALYVEAVAHAPNGAWPLSLTGCYGEDGDHLRHYAEAARTDDGFATYLEQHVLGVGED